MNPPEAGGDDWNPLLWDSRKDAVQAALKTGAYTSEKEADDAIRSVAGVIRMAEGKPDIQDVFLHYFNLTETYRRGGTYQDWLASSGFQ